jgi:nucleoside-diphosphate-sugar epimerase
MSKGKVSVLGSNGNCGQAAMVAFRDAGWDVTGLCRTRRKPVPDTKTMLGNADDLDTVRAAIAEADTVTYGLHLRYDQWGDGRAERQLQVVLDAMAGSGKTLLFPGTIYNYRATDRTVSPGLRQSAEKPRGEIRIRLETMLKEASETKDIQVVILRAGDFFGPDNRGGWYDAAMLMHAGKGRIYHLGDLPTRHSWAYLPDLGRAFVALAEQRKSLQSFENFHFAGHWVSHGQIMQAIAAALPVPVKTAPLPWWMLRAAGLVNPVMRDIVDMRYLWRNEMELVDARLDALLGANAVTPFETAVADTVAGLAATRQAA